MKTRSSKCSEEQDQMTQSSDPNLTNTLLRLTKTPIVKGIDALRKKLQGLNKIQTNTTDIRHNKRHMRKSLSVDNIVDGSRPFQYSVSPVLPKSQQTGSLFGSPEITNGAQMIPEPCELRGEFTKSIAPLDSPKAVVSNDVVQHDERQHRTNSTGNHGMSDPTCRVVQPKKSQKKKANPKKNNKSKQTNLYCYQDCKVGRRHDREIIQCSLCMKWHHVECSDAEDTTALTWNCMLCRNMPHTVNLLVQQVSDLKGELNKMCELSQNLIDMLRSKTTECERAKSEILALQAQLREVGITSQNVTPSAQAVTTTGAAESVTIGANVKTIQGSTTQNGPSHTQHNRRRKRRKANYPTQPHLVQPNTCPSENKQRQTPVNQLPVMMQQMPTQMYKVPPPMQPQVIYVERPPINHQRIQPQYHAYGIHNNVRRGWNGHQSHATIRERHVPFQRNIQCFRCGAWGHKADRCTVF